MTRKQNKKETAKAIDFKTDAEIMRENEAKREAEQRAKREAEQRAKREAEELEAEEFEAETERLQLEELTRRANEAMKPKQEREERFAKTRSPNKELQQLLAIQRHQSQLAAWEHRRQKYGKSGYKAGHSPLANRSKKAAES